jgi:hypothetical protein
VSMAGLLRLNIPTFPAIPLLGGHEIVGGCVALTLDSVRTRMAARHAHLAERYPSPPDPAALPATYSEQMKRDRLQFEMNQHQEYLRLSAAIAEVEAAIDRGDDLERTAVLLPLGRGEIERWSGMPILTGQFAWAECRSCGRRYTPEECGQSDWSRVADPRAGIGGRCLACLAGHVLFAKQTWVA